MKARRKFSPLIEIQVINQQFKLHLDIPLKWIMLIAIALLIYFMPEFWAALQVAITTIP